MNSRTYPNIDDPKFQEKIKRELAKWDKKMEPQIEKLRNMERITAKDLAIIVR